MLEKLRSEIQSIKTPPPKEPQQHGLVVLLKGQSACFALSQTTVLLLAHNFCPQQEVEGQHVFERTWTYQEWSSGKLLVRINFITTILENGLKVLQKAKIEFSDDPNSTILGIRPKNGYQDVQYGSTVMLIIALLTARKKQKQVK
jgi:hypothetical protein